MLLLNIDFGKMTVLKKDIAQMTSVRLYEVDRCRRGSDRLF